MKETAVAEADYVSAKQHQLDNPKAYEVEEPSEEVLANVAIINGFELAEPFRSEELQRERDSS